MDGIYLSNIEEHRNLVKDLPKNSIVDCRCHNCHNIFKISRSLLLRKFLNYRVKDAVKKYCSKSCAYDARNTKHDVVCKNCNKNFRKVANQAIKYPNHFCSSSCAATFNNKHKTHGTRRSKLEVYLEEQIKINYPNINMICNQKDAINSELDFYFPDLKFAIELNGIFHYEPIYGKEKLLQTQNNDNRKFQACLERGIELCIVDTSKCKHLTQSSKDKFYKIISNLIDMKKCQS